jgi:hypothetical protein
MSLGQRSLAWRVPDRGIAPMQIERFGEARNYAMCKVAAKTPTCRLPAGGQSNCRQSLLPCDEIDRVRPAFQPDEATVSACLFSSRGAYA